MEYTKFDYAVIGGDMRQVYLAEELAHHQNRVTFYALMASPKEQRCSDSSCVKSSLSLEAACARSQCIICPIPFCKKGDTISCQGGEDLSLDLLLSFLHCGHYLFGGNIPEDFFQAAKSKGVLIWDLLKEDSLAYYNTIATAEGAVCEAISKSPCNLHKSQCAVLGFGRCGSTLAQYLKGMFCHVHIFSRDCLECAKAAITADTVNNLLDLEENAESFDFIFNTIPAPVITGEILGKMKRSAVIIDMASAPGGVDYEAAKRLGIKALLCPGLPGKYAPMSTAGAVKTAIETILGRV